MTDASFAGQDAGDRPAGRAAIVLTIAIGLGIGSLWTSKLTLLLDIAFKIVMSNR